MQFSIQLPESFDHANLQPLEGNLSSPALVSLSLNGFGGFGSPGSAGAGNAASLARVRFVFRTGPKPLGHREGSLQKRSLHYSQRYLWSCVFRQAMHKTNVTKRERSPYKWSRDHAITPKLPPADLARAALAAQGARKVKNVTSMVLSARWSFLHPLHAINSGQICDG